MEGSQVVVEGKRGADKIIWSSLTIWNMRRDSQWNWGILVLTELLMLSGQFWRLTHEDKRSRGGMLRMLMDRIQLIFQFHLGTWQINSKGTKTVPEILLYVKHLIRVHDKQLWALQYEVSPWYIWTYLGKTNQCLKITAVAMDVKGSINSIYNYLKENVYYHIPIYKWGYLWHSKK